MSPVGSRFGPRPRPRLWCTPSIRAAECYGTPPARRSVPCHRLRWPWPRLLVYKLATKAPDAALVLMAAAAAAAALAAADPPPAMPQAAGAGGSTARRDFYWLRSFLAGGGCPPTGPGRSRGGRGTTWGRSVACGRNDILGQWLFQCSAR